MFIYNFYNSGGTIAEFCSKDYDNNSNAFLKNIYKDI